MYFIEMPGARDFTRTNKTPYLAIDERALGKKRSFVSVRYAVKYFIMSCGLHMCLFISSEVQLSCYNQLIIARLSFKIDMLKLSLLKRRLHC